MTLEQTFQKEALVNAQTAMATHGCPTKRLYQTLDTHGGVETARELAKKHRSSDGFEALRQCGHLELTLEALMVKGKYGCLFTDEEINWCFELLVDAGYFYGQQGAAFQKSAGGRKARPYGETIGRTYSCAP